MVEYESISNLTPYPNNPRKWNDEDVYRLAESIRSNPELFEARPVIVSKRKDGTQYVLGGHLRIEAAKRLGKEAVPVYRFVGLSKEREREIVLRDNIQNGEWNWDLLTTEWNDLPFDAWGVDVGFDEDAHIIDKTSGKYESTPFESIETDEDVNIGDVIYFGDGYSLICDDYRNQSAYKDILSGASLVFADPPYEIDNVDFSKESCELLENFYFMLMHDDIGIASHIKQSSLKFKQFFCLDFRKSSPRGNNPYLRHILVSLESKGNVIPHQNMLDGFSSIISMKYRNSIEERTHAHEKDSEALSKLISHYTKEGDTVIDLFAGSGVMFEVCKQIGRKCVAFEINPLYCGTIKKRLNSWKPTN